MEHVTRGLITTVERCLAPYRQHLIEDLHCLCHAGSVGDALQTLIKTGRVYASRPSPGRVRVMATLCRCSALAATVIFVHLGFVAAVDATGWRDDRQHGDRRGRLRGVSTAQAVAARAFSPLRFPLSSSPSSRHGAGGGSSATTLPGMRPTATAAPAVRLINIPAGGCRGVRSVRKEVRSLSAAEWTRYTNAVATLRKTPGTGGLSVYENFVQAHIQFNAQAHGGAYFLPWHRQMLLEYEAALNAVAPGVSIPYWDWTKFSTRYRSDTVFWARYGGARSGEPIPNAPFKGWTSALESPHAVVRGFTVNTLTPQDLYFVSAANIRLWTSDTARSFSTCKLDAGSARLLSGRGLGAAR
jgi:Common central domain of tyrosinase